MSKFFHFTLIMSMFCICTAVVKAERNASQICKPRTPLLEYKEAVSLAEKEKDKFFKSDEAFIDLVKLVCEKNKYKWEIGFRRKAYETGHLIISVFMNKKMTVSVVKDG